MSRGAAHTVIGHRCAEFYGLGFRLYVIYQMGLEDEPITKKIRVFM
jgi:hypothetical protein